MPEVYGAAAGLPGGGRVRSVTASVARIYGNRLMRNSAAFLA